jgi:lipoyl(octanoyl) transferase
VSRIKIIDLGFLDFKNSWNYQKELQKKVLSGYCSDSIIFVEHDSVYTFGKNSDKSNLLVSRDSKIEIYETERGGEITYHGPGQLVCYPILNLKNFKQSVTWYMRALEEVIIETLKLFNIKASRKDGLTGVWVKDEKIGAQGVRMTKWVTMHGFALNVNTDLRYFNDIIPCGIKDFGVTSIKKIIGKEQDLSLVKEYILISFAKVFNIKGYT